MGKARPGLLRSHFLGSLLLSQTPTLRRLQPSKGSGLLVSKRRGLLPNWVDLCSSWTTMAEQPQQVAEGELQSSQAPKEDMIPYVMALEAALLPCLPARELQAIDRSSHPSHQIDVEGHARDFMEAAKKLQLYFVGLQREDQPTMAETLRKDIAMMEEELKVKNDLIKKQERLIQGWRKELKDQLDKHNNELERV